MSASLETCDFVKNLLQWTPLELARWLQERAPESFPIDWSALSKALGSRFAITDELASALRVHFDLIIAESPRTPLGPVCSLDPQIKKSLQWFVWQAAFETTENFGHERSVYATAPALCDTCAIASVRLAKCNSREISTIKNGNWTRMLGSSVQERGGSLGGSLGGSVLDIGA